MLLHGDNVSYKGDPGYKVCNIDDTDPDNPLYEIVKVEGAMQWTSDYRWVSWNAIAYLGEEEVTQL